MQNTMAKILFDTVSFKLTWTALACGLLAVMLFERQALAPVQRLRHTVAEVSADC